MQNDLKFNKKEKEILMLLVLLSANKLVCSSLSLSSACFVNLALNIPLFTQSYSYWHFVM